MLNAMTVEFSFHASALRACGKYISSKMLAIAACVGFPQSLLSTL